jgi:DNA-binding GntR family transcriptional regulator
MEQHGHNGYDIYIDVQRPMLIDVNIRELAEFTEIRKKESKDGKTIWHVRNIPGSAELDRYIASGKKDTTCYTEEKVVIDYDVHQCYDHQMCKPKFFEGYLRQDFDTIEAEPIEESLEGYIKYLQEVDDELPPGFYRKEAV